MELKAIKDKVAIEKDYPSWEEMENWLIDHGGERVVIAQLLVVAMEDVAKEIIASKDKQIAEANSQVDKVEEGYAKIYQAYNDWMGNSKRLSSVIDSKFKVWQEALGIMKEAMSLFRDSRENGTEGFILDQHNAMENKIVDFVQKNDSPMDWKRQIS